MLIGLIVAIYLYGFAFDDFSETELVQVSYIWIAAIIFGTHGLLAYEYAALLTEDETLTTTEVLKQRREQPNRSLFSKISSAFLWSFLLMTTAPSRRRPVLCGLLAVVIWIAGLIFFFEVIFPEL